MGRESMPSIRARDPRAFAAWARRGGWAKSRRAAKAWHTPRVAFPSTDSRELLRALSPRSVRC